MSSNRDRRQFARADIRWPATVITSDTQVGVETEDISQVGVSLSCQDSLPLGQEFRLEIHPPDRQPLIVTAKTVWTEVTNSEEDIHRFLVGAVFEYISESDIRFIDEIIAGQMQERD